MSEVSPNVADQVAVGTCEILESPHVSEGPGRIASAPIPSVFVDDRGSIHRLRIGRQRVNLLYSHKECMRSGYLNSVRTHDFVLQGRVEVWLLTPEGTEKKVYEAHEYFSVGAYVPHILYFLEETNLAEWYGGTFQCWYYRPYRNIVNVQNSLIMQNSPAKHHRLVQEVLVSGSSSGNGRPWLYTAAAFFSGCLLGAAVTANAARRR